MSARVRGEQPTRRWGGAKPGMLLMLLVWGTLLVVVGLGVWTLTRSGRRRGIVGAGSGAKTVDVSSEPRVEVEKVREVYEETRQNLEE